MDAQTCLKKLQCVGVLNFSTVGLDGALYQRHPLYFGRALFFHCARKRILP